MPKEDPSSAVGRRRFLQQSAGAAVLAGTATALAESGTLAGSIQAVKPGAAKTLTLMARDLYPHDRLDDHFYAKAVAMIDAKLMKDAKGQLLDDGVVALDKAATSAKGKPYAALSAEPDRVAVLNSIEDTPFFETMRAEMVTALYNQPEVWAKLGYEGPSADKGGYINRGFNDIDWLQA